MPNLFRAARSGLLLLTLGAGLALSAGTAAASPPPASAICKGATSAVKGDATQVAYTFHCNQTIKSYSILSTVPVAGFDINVSVFTPSGAIDTNDAWGCEGDIPGDGFHCNGSAVYFAVTTGQFEPESDAPCSAKGKWIPRTWVTVADYLGQIEGPFRLKAPKTCKPAKAAKRASKTARRS